MAKNDTAVFIEEAVLKSTIKIHTSAKIHGTGFIISKEIGEKQKKLFLITNKHLVGNYSLVDGQVHDYFDFITLSVNYKDGSQNKTNIYLKNTASATYISKVSVHPEPYVDVAVVEISDETAGTGTRQIVSLDSSHLATDEIAELWNVNMGDLVFTLGFLHNIYSQSADYPILKSGYIASRIGEEKIIKFDYLDRNKNIVSREIKTRVILLDGTLVGGSSGGPIITPRGRRERIKARGEAVRMGGKTLPNLIIGIQSPSFIESGISVAFGSEYILELIDKNSV